MKTKAQISCAVTAQLISTFLFASQIVQFLLYLYPKFQDSSFLLCVYRQACVGPSRTPRRLVFSRCDLIRLEVVSHNSITFLRPIHLYKVIGILYVLDGKVGCKLGRQRSHSFFQGEVWLSPDDQGGGCNFTLHFHWLTKRCSVPVDRSRYAP